jgi:hypothetical protein
MVAAIQRAASAASLPFRKSIIARFQSTAPTTMAPLSASDINPTFHTVQYAVRGELAIKAETLREELKRPNHGLPFDKVISSNIGNPQQKGLDQPPITFTRQVGITDQIIDVLSCLFYSWAGGGTDGMARTREARARRVPRGRYRTGEGTH